MRKIVSTLLPKSVYEAVSLYRRVQRNRELNSRLQAEHAHELPADLIRNLRVLPSRRELLQQLPAEAVVAEVGVASGEFSREIVRICRPRKLYLIDLWGSTTSKYGTAPMDRTRANVKGALDDGTAEILRGYSWDMLAQLPDRSLDWVYVDASHSFEAVQKDLEAARAKVRDGGIIAGHDYTRWSGNGLSRWGVVEAVNEFCVRHRWELLFLSNESHRHLSYAIRRVAGVGDPSPAGEHGVLPHGV